MTGGAPEAGLPEAMTIPALPEAMTIPALLVLRAEQCGDRIAVRAGSVAVSYRRLVCRASSMANALHANGIRAGDRVAAVLDNRIELIDLVLGCAWLGAVAVPLNVALRGDGLRHALAESGAGWVFVEPHHAGQVEATGFPGVCWIAGSASAPRVDPAASEPPRDPAPVADLDLAAILFTSGTTGLPKGVRCPHAQFLWWGAGVGRSLGVEAGDVLYNCLPLFHTNALGSLFQALVWRGTFVLGERFSATDYWRRVEESGATVTYLLGAMVAILMNRPPSPNDRAHRATRALSPATPAHLYEPFRTRFGIDLVDGFGTTETNLVIGSLPGHRRDGFLGTVMDGYEAAVVDGGRPAPDGTPGELMVRSLRRGAFAAGYLGDPVPAEGAWLRTGDRVIRDADGWFRFVDRLKDVIRRRGENISATEVESVLAQHPAVAQVAVFPVPSALAEDEVMAAIVPRDGAAFDPADLLRFAERHLAYFALPRYLDLVPALPLTETGKVRKQELRARGVGPATWDAEREGFLPTRPH
ncbi:crotonobetaine/carnitine-CoA ligase [Nocardia transvalensis]|uniref:Crotonobetaine/carnitine-CoA ligase n=1 Tax=Nocardia transvalensis TaxID=37333 RepID=A0A7W9PHB1_9NOCA|nr:AMP-binding protein [Nocardia transvalensis]MBB5916147.1 crotonobetaine/carnitine-CoA ligase [Nocardia transvalensis]